MLTLMESRELGMKLFYGNMIWIRNETPAAIISSRDSAL